MRRRTKACAPVRKTRPDSSLYLSSRVTVRSAVAPAEEKAIRGTPKIVFLDAAGTAYMVPPTKEEAIVSPLRKGADSTRLDRVAANALQALPDRKQHSLQLLDPDIDAESRRGVVWTRETPGNRWHAFGMPRHRNRDVACAGD